MIKFDIKLEGADDAFARLGQAVTDLTPVMQEIGEHLAETTKRRFDSSTGPSGERWAQNSETTFLRFVGKYKGASGKDGRINTKGAARVMSKKPLIGETHALQSTINYNAGGNFVEIGSPMLYAGVQQFGAAKHAFAGGRNPWGDIPARPFLGLSEADGQEILDIIGDHIARASAG